MINNNNRLKPSDFNECDCTVCDNTNCIHRYAYRRLPEVIGGCGLCYNLHTTSAECGDYSPGNPWDAPGMSIKDFF